MKIFGITVVVFTLCAFCGSDAEDDSVRRVKTVRIPSDAQILEGPITVAGSCVGYFEEDSGWYLSINSAGHACVFTEPFTNKKTRDFVIDEGKMKKLRESLIEQKFFELNDRYGDNVPDGGSDRMTITVGDITKSVRIDFLMNSEFSKDREKVSGAIRALEVLACLVGTFDEERSSGIRGTKRILEGRMKE